MKVPGTIWYPSPIQHPNRSATWGIVIHWTAGHKPGDLAALTGGHVDVHFYVTKTGEVYQFVDSDSQAWHAFQTANHYCIGIEHEGSGEPWTPAQFNASVKLARWCCATYDIPVRHTNPESATPGPQWAGLYGHADLVHINGNDHSDTVPVGIGWPQYIRAIKEPPTIAPPYFEWLAWTLGEGWAGGHAPFDKAIRPEKWKPRVPSTYWVRRLAFLAKRKTRK